MAIVKSGEYYDCCLAAYSGLRSITAGLKYQRDAGYLVSLRCLSNLVENFECGARNGRT